MYEVKVSSIILREEYLAKEGLGQSHKKRCARPFSTVAQPKP